MGFQGVFLTYRPWLQRNEKISDGCTIVVETSVRQNRPSVRRRSEWNSATKVTRSNKLFVTAVNWHISYRISTRIIQAFFGKIHAEVCQFTRIATVSWDACRGFATKFGSMRAPDPDWKKQQRSGSQLSEKLGFLGSMESPWNPSNITQHYGIEGFKGVS